MLNFAKCIYQKKAKNRAKEKKKLNFLERDVIASYLSDLTRFQHRMILESEDELESSDLRYIPQDQGHDLTRYADKRSVSERVQPYDVSYKLLFVHCISGFYTRSSPWNSPFMVLLIVFLPHCDIRL